jgi:hypothetical protein
MSTSVFFIYSLKKNIYFRCKNEIELFRQNFIFKIKYLHMFIKTKFYCVQFTMKLAQVVRKMKTAFESYQNYAYHFQYKGNVLTGP